MCIPGRDKASPEMPPAILSLSVSLIYCAAGGERGGAGVPSGRGPIRLLLSAGEKQMGLLLVRVETELLRVEDGRG